MRVKQKRKRTYWVQFVFPEHLEASSPEEALKLIKKAIFLNGLTISVEDFGDGDGIEEDWNILQDLGGLFSAGRN
jgi:hypothetical protein